MGMFSNFFSFKRFFSMKRELAMDLGTANTIIIADGEIAVNEPSVVALDPHTEKTIAVGERAKLMYEKTNDKIHVVRPLRDGVIADFNACELMMRGLIQMVSTGRHLFTPHSVWSSVSPRVLPKWSSVPSVTLLSMPADAMCTLFSSLWPQPLVSVSTSMPLRDRW